MITRFAKAHPWVHILDPQASAGLARRMQAAQELVPHSVTHPAWSPERGIMLGHFEVISASTPGLSYTVSLATGCNCPDGTTRAPMGWCKHRLAAWLYVQHMESHGVRIAQKESAQAVA